MMDVDLLVAWAWTLFVACRTRLLLRAIKVAALTRFDDSLPTRWDDVEPSFELGLYPLSSASNTLEDEGSRDGTGEDIGAGAGTGAELSR